MSPGDVPTPTNAGGMILLAAVIVLLGALAGLARPRRCPECGGRVERSPELWRLEPDGTRYRICAACFSGHVTVAPGQPSQTDGGVTWPGPYLDHPTPEAAAREWRQWQDAGRPPIPGLWP